VVRDVVKASHYFIDQLKTEFCEEKPGGWFKIKETTEEEVESSALVEEKVNKIFEIEANHKNFGKWNT